MCVSDTGRGRGAGGYPLMKGTGGPSWMDFLLFGLRGSRISVLVGLALLISALILLDYSTPFPSCLHLNPHIKLPRCEALIPNSLTDKSLHSAAIFDSCARVAGQTALAQGVHDAPACALSIAPWCSPA